MKKFLILLAALTLVLAVAGQAGAAVKFGATGNWQFSWAYNQNLPSLDAKVEHDKLAMWQRVNTTFSVEANEYVRGDVLLRVGSTEWGNHNRGPQGSVVAVTGQGGSASGRQVLDLRASWLTTKFPDSSVALLAGIMPLAFPAAALGSNPVLNDRYPALAVAFPVGDVGSATLVYTRPYLTPAYNSTTVCAKYNAFDVVAGILDLNFGSFSVAPYVAYGIAGHQAVPYAYYGGDPEKDSKVMIVGAAFKISPINNLNVGLDAIFGNVSNSEGDLETSGFLAGLSVDYTMSFGTPGLFAWYGSGSKGEKIANDGKAGVLPLLGPDGGITRTRFATHNSRITMNPAANIAARNAVGTIGLGLQLADVKSMDKLSHTLRLAYIKGNNKETGDGFNRLGLRGNNEAWLGAFGMDKDYSLIEFDLENTYAIVSNLNLWLDLGVIAPSIKDKDQKSHGLNTRATGGEKADTGFTAEIGLIYSF